MATLKPMQSMMQFLDIRPGEWWLAQYVDRVEVEIKGEARTSLHFRIFKAGKGEIPQVEELIGFLNSTPMDFLTGANKSLTDALAEVESPSGEVFLIYFGGQKEIGGGRKFNQWQIFHIELSEVERDSVGLTS